MYPRCGLPRMMAGAHLWRKLLTYSETFLFELGWTGFVRFMRQAGPSWRLKPNSSPIGQNFKTSVRDDLMMWATEPWPQYGTEDKKWLIVAWLMWETRSCGLLPQRIYQFRVNLLVLFWLLVVWRKFTQTVWVMDGFWKYWINDQVIKAASVAWCSKWYSGRACAF